MKLAVNDRVKHRIVGLAVILSVIAIFLPAIFKRTNQPFDTLSRVSVRLPQKPSTPEVKMVEQAKLFRTVKTARVEIRPLPAPAQTAVAVSRPVSLVHQPAPHAHVEVAQANLPKANHVESLPHASVLPPTPKIEKRREQTTRVVIKQQQPVDAPKVVISKQTSPAGERVIVSKSPSAYAVQVASFSNLDNANILIQKLKSRGFEAHYASVNRARGQTSYRVLVGRAVKKDEVLKLQQELASQMKIQGFVVPAEIG